MFLIGSMATRCVASEPVSTATIFPLAETSTCPISLLIPPAGNQGVKSNV